MATAITTADRVIFTRVILVVVMAAGVAIDSQAQPVVQAGRRASAAPLNFTLGPPMEQCIKFRRIAFWTGLLLAVFAVALITWSAWFNPWNNPPVFSDAVVTQVHAVTDVDRLRGIALKLIEMHTALNTDVAAMVHAWVMALALFALFVALFLIWFSRAMPRDVDTQGVAELSPNTAVKALPSVAGTPLKRRPLP